MLGLTKATPGAAAAFVCVHFGPQGGDGQGSSIQGDSGESALGLFCVMSTFGCIIEKLFPLCREPGFLYVG